MRKIDLRISDAMKRLADNAYQKLVEEIDRSYSHMKVNPLTFHMMRSGDKDIYLRSYTQWAEEKVQARFETYRDAFRKDNVIPNEADLSEMSCEFGEIIVSVSSEIPDEAQTILNQNGKRIIKDAQRDIQILISDMRYEQLEARKPDPPSSVHYNINIGENRGPIQQAGENNTQNINHIRENEDYLYFRERFSCLHCGAELTALVNNDDSDYTEYACGHAYGGSYSNPCPRDPEFPALEEYEMKLRGKDNRWYCHPEPKTRAAHKLTLDGAWGETPEEAKARVAKNYNSRARHVRKNKQIAK